MSYVLTPGAADLLGTALKTVVGPLSGALAGALAAQGIAKRNAGIQRRIDEMRATNAATGTASGIVNLAAALKRQHVKRMKETYDKASDECDAAFGTSGQGVFRFQADLETVPTFRPPVPVLERLLYDKVNSPPAVLALYTLLTQSAAGVNDSGDERNGIIRSLKARSPIPDEELANIYFGLVDAQGHVDARFRHSLEGLVMNLDCVLLFSFALVQELTAHAERISADGKPPKGLPKVVRFGFQAIADEGLFPPIDASTMRTFKSLGLEVAFPAASLADGEAGSKPGDP